MLFDENHTSTPRVPAGMVAAGSVTCDVLTEECLKAAKL